MQPFPHPNDASDKIWLKLACRLRFLVGSFIYSVFSGIYEVAGEPG